MTKGLTFNIQRFSTEDGPGIRTTVFMKGCPLRCAWCHNPEGLSPRLDLTWYDVRCIGARDCLGACPENALTLTAQGMRIERARCTVCGKCAEACPSAAFEVIGKSWDPAELVEELVKDRVFYETSGGGVTFGGGEPMLQADFVCAAAERCQAAGLAVAIDTSGAVAWERYARVLPHIDLVLLDLKIMDAARHKAATGVSNELIQEHARRLTAEKPMWIRTPIIPGYTDDPENIRAIAQFIRQELPSVERWDLLAYTNLGRPKYHRLDLPYALENVALLTNAEMESLWQVAAASVPAARWSGATR